MPSQRTHRARSLRQSSGRAEERVWSRLRGSKLDGHKFKRQHPIGPYYADFACERLRLIVEIDGSVHLLDEVIERDRRRQKALEALGWRVMRFTNEQVLHAPERLTDAVRRHADGLGT
jgi:very-short-patch-repair endonuclease